MQLKRVRNGASVGKSLFLEASSMPKEKYNQATLSSCQLDMCVVSKTSMIHQMHTEYAFRVSCAQLT